MHIAGSRQGFDEAAPSARDAELARTQTLYATLSRVNQAIVHAADRDGLFATVCRALVEHGGFRMAWIGWHQAQSRTLVPVAQWGDDSGYLQRIRVSTEDRPEGRGPSGMAMCTGRPCVSADLAGNPALQPWHQELERAGLRASAAFPIRCRGEVCGTLNLYSDDPWFFQDREVALLGEIAADVSFGLDSFARDEDRRQAEQKVRQERDFSESILDSLPGVLYLYDESGRFLRWNRQFEQVTGYTAAEIAGMRPTDFFAPHERALVAGRIAEVFERGKSQVEAGLLAKDGTVTEHQFTGVVTQFEGRRCLVGVGIDISERKREEAARQAERLQAGRALAQAHEALERKVVERTAELEAALVRAEAADRLKSAFLATMSHELRTPLNSILGFTSIVLQGKAGPLNDEQTRQLGMARGSARHLLALIGDVLDISRIEAGQMEVQAEPFDLAASVTRMAETVRPQAAAHGIALVVRLPPAPATIVSDRRRVEQILLNLLNNAIKFTEQGEVCIAAAWDDGAAGPAPGRPAVRIEVTDTGIGIRPQDLDQLFQPFRQIDTGLARVHEGTGLGLAICRRLADLLGGAITVRSQWGRGSTFTVLLPITPEPLP